jgi:hypothetical protein
LPSPASAAIVCALEFLLAQLVAAAELATTPNSLPCANAVLAVDGSVAP